MIKLGRLAVLIALFLAFIACNVTSVKAQEPEPTATPTPSYQQGIVMSTGSTLLIEKSVSYGDIATVIAILILAAVTLLRGMIEIPKIWSKR